MKTEDNSGANLRRALEDRIAALEKRAELLKQRAERAQSELTKVEDELKDVTVKIRLVDAKHSSRPIAGFDRITRKNAAFHEAWIRIQIAFQSPGNSHLLGPEHGLTQKRLRFELLRRGFEIKEATFRSYLFRLRKDGLLWKNKGKWHLTKLAIDAAKNNGSKGEERNQTE